METLTLQAETSRLLALVIHSLYTRPEVFLRELVSNASDALDRFRLESMVRPELQDEVPLEITIEVDPAARVLCVRDNGIGMNREEVIGHIGTIARSGTEEFASGLQTSKDREQALNFIGRFGVGFYSSFMVADNVTLVTRRAGERAVRWESSGDIHYTITEVDDVPRGTSVTLQLKAADEESGLENYTDRYVLSRIVKHYADFVTFPIKLLVKPEPAAAPDGGQSGATEPIVLNSMKPIWTRREADVKPEEYVEFYKHLSHDWDEPLLRMAFKAEGRWEYAALLFVPKNASHDLYYHASPYGLQLFSQRMLIVHCSQDVLPRYLRFLKGVVDAVDLPLNVSRQNLQHTQHLANIRRWLTRKVLDTFNNIRVNEPDKYHALWKEFGRAIKEGVSEDRDNLERLTPLLLFESSLDGSQLTTLGDYVERMKPEQKEIFYLTGESRSIIERSPHLEEVRARGYEVLFLADPVDELLTQCLSEFSGRRLRSVAKGDIDFDNKGTSDEQSHDEFEALLEFLGKRLDAHVRSVRISKRLTHSPACLTGGEFDYSPHIERLLSTGNHRRLTRRTLEVNPKHPIIQGMRERLFRDSADPALIGCAELLLGWAMLSEGSDLPDAVGFTTRLIELMARSITQANHEVSVI